MNRPRMSEMTTSMNRRKLRQRQRSWRTPIDRASRRTALVAFAVLAVLASACSSAPVDTATPSDSTGTESQTASETTTETKNDAETPTDTGSTDTSDTTVGTDSGSSGGGIASLAGVNFRSRLEPFAECGAYLDHIKAAALERVGPWGLEGQGFFGGPMLEMSRDMRLDDMEFEVMEEAESSDAMLDSTAGSVAAPQAVPSSAGADVAFGSDGEGTTFSGTNVQVDGVDEPDIVKTDGERIITLRGNHLDVVDVTGAEPVISTSLELSTWGQDMLLFGDTVLVMGTDWGPSDFFPMPFASGDAESDFAASDAIDDRMISPEFEGNSGPITSITQISIAGQARVVSSMRAEGNFVSARMIGDIVRLVVSSPPPNIGWVFPQSQSTEEIAEQANRSIIEQSTLSDWLPTYSVLDESGTTTSGDLLACNEMHRPTEFAGFSTLSVLTVDIDGPLALSGATGVLADGQTVYASNNSLYVGTTVWDGDLWARDIAPEAISDTYSTSLHRFDISDPTRASYVASGSVDGSMLSQFSMHEWDGRLFVATTEGASWGQMENSESFITVLEPNGQDLVQVGRVGNMGLGERIFAVRFIGSNAYVVTFRQVDPLYIVDLSNPTAPVVTGELKVPGFSTYLHSVGDGLLLGVGQDATDQGRTIGAKLSLFDISNPANPTELDTWVMPNSGSSAEWDHRAFLYWEPRSLAVLPVTNWEEAFGGAVAVNITRENGITEIGRLDNTVPDDGTGPASTCDVYSSPWEDEIQVCEPGEEPAKSGGVCYQEEWLGQNPDELKYMAEEFGIDEIIVPDNADIYWCYFAGPRFESISRSIIIGDDVWTLSERSLQRNDLETLSRQARVELTGEFYG